MIALAGIYFNTFAEIMQYIYVTCLSCSNFFDDSNSFLFFGQRGQALCTVAAVVGGKSLASQISEKMVLVSIPFYVNCL